MSNPVSPWGISCWNTQMRRFACQNHFDAEPGETHADMEKRAGAQGWVIGHSDGQGHYACPDCANTLFDPIILG